MRRAANASRSWSASSTTASWGYWIHAKFALALVLIAYHLYCGRLLKDFALDRNTKSHVWFRWFNEFPVLVLFAAVWLVLFKPF